MRKNLPLTLFNIRRTLGRIILFVTLTNSFLLVSTAAHSQAQLLKDINKVEAVTDNEYSNFTVVNGKTFFVSRGIELWITDGSNTYRLRTFKSISNLTMVGNFVYFAADDGSAGSELWKSSGSASGTVRVKDIRPGSTGSSPKFFTNVNGVLYFVANDGSHGNEVWKSNGTSAGTFLVKDIFTGSGSSSPSRLTNVNGILYFSANNNINGYELWKSNGSASGTLLVKDIYPGSKLGSHPELLTNVNGTLFFVALDPTTGRELWKSNGTSSGTVRVKDIYAGSSSSSIDNLINVNGTLFFVANDGVNGIELWKSNGTSSGTMLVKDTNAGSLSLYAPANFANMSGILFFTANRKIYRSDGTSAGTTLVENINGYFEGTPIVSFTELNGFVYYFNAQYNPDDYEAESFLMKTDLSGQNVTEVIYLASAEEIPQRSEMVRFNSWLIFAGRPYNERGYKLMRSDGTTEGTIVIKDTYIPNRGSNPYAMFNVNGVVYFKTEDDNSTFFDAGLWKTDGTPAGTVRLKTFYNINQMYPVGNTLFFGVEYAQSKYQLWKIVSPSTTPVLVKELPERVLEYPQFNRSINGIFYFMVDYVLWRSDGTEAGTYPLHGFHYVKSVDVLGSNLYIRIYNPDYQEEIWKSNGTIDGTYKLKTIRPTAGNRTSSNEPAVVMNGVLYFSADDGTTGMELWRTNGTASGTYRVIDLRSGDAGVQDVDAMAVFNNKLYFGVVDNTGHWSLYATNGTASGTTKIKDMSDKQIQTILPNPAGSFMYVFTRASDGLSELYNSNGTETTLVANLQVDYFNQPADFEFINNRLFFITGLNLYGPSQNNLWVSDGSSCGTMSIHVGPGSLYPLERLGDLLLFGAYTPEMGREPYAWNINLAPASPCGTTIAGAAEFDTQIVDDREIVRYGPNPFSNDISILVSGDEGETSDLEIFTSTGSAVEIFQDLETNIEHRIGQSWNPGIYIMRLNKRGVITTYKIAKK